MKVKNSMGMIIFLVSFIVGIVFTLLCKDTYFKWTGKNIWQEIPGFEVNSRYYLLFLAQQRMPVYILLWIMGTTIFGICIILFVMAWIGCSAGIVLTISYICSGINGIAVMVLSLLPHGILYLYGLSHFYGLIIGYRYKEKPEHHLTTIYKKKNFDKLVRNGLPLWFLAIILECYIAPIWLNKLITFFL